MRLSISRKLFLSHLLAVFLVSGSVGTYFYLNAAESLMANLRNRLKNSAALVSQVLDARELETVRTPSDVSLPAYRSYLELLRGFKRTNPDIAFLYVMRLEKDKVFFVIDSDETQKQALPGKEYEVEVPTLRAGFHRPSVDDRIYTDEWGSTMSGYAPIKNGEGRYLVGMDMRADEVSHKLHRLRMSGFISLVFSVILALAFSLLLSSHFIKRIRVLRSQCGAIAEGQLGASLDFRAGDEFDTLIRAFNTMSGQLATSRDENTEARKALEKSRDGLEGKVVERTRDLTKVNEALLREVAERKRAEKDKERLIEELRESLSQIKTLKGLLPICASCKKIRDDQGYWNQLETYIKERSDAEFSHGLCPECARKLYPELYDKEA
jgi:methyl-accepting chemotaxis protein